MIKTNGAKSIKIKVICPWKRNRGVTQDEKPFEKIPYLRSLGIKIIVFDFKITSWNLGHLFLTSYYHWILPQGMLPLNFNSRKARSNLDALENIWKEN